MRKLALICVASMMSFAMVSCGGSAPEKKADARIEMAEGSFMVHPEKAQMKWTAFKFTDRVGVSGTFDDIQTEGAKVGASVPEALEGMEFRISTSSVNSNSEDRDGKLQKFFFGTMKGGETITGRFSSFEGEDRGMYRTDLVINNHRRPLVLQYQVDEREIVLRGKLNLAEHEALRSVESINAKCDILHKGKDGVSKLWPDIDIEVHIPYSHKN